jgi:DMSO reductase family type II enzyme chaperone
MVSPIVRIEARSQLYMMLATSFAHPQSATYAAMQSGNWQKTLSELLELVLGITDELPTYHVAFADFEAFYIDMFEVGRKGQPKIALCASGYPAILNGDSLPEFLLRYTRWYRHFGLDTTDAELGSQPADHLVCQLELIAWLSHLQANCMRQQDDPAACASAQEIAYQKAQRDFIQRELLPTVQSIAETLLHAEKNNAALRQEFSPMCSLILKVIERTFQELDSVLGPAMVSVVEVGVEVDCAENEIAAVNIWD